MIGLDDRAICSSLNRARFDEVLGLPSEDTDFSLSGRENNEIASNGLIGVILRLPIRGNVEGVARRR